MSDQKEETYTVEITLTKDDYCNFQTQFCNNVITTKVIYTLSALILSLFTAEAFQTILNETSMAYNGFLSEDVVFLSIAFIVFLFLLHFFSVFSKENVHDDNDLFFHPQTIHIDRAGLTIKSTHYNSSVKWQGIQKIIENDDAIYFFIGKMHAYILPKRSLDETVDLLIEQINKYWSAKTGKRVKNPWKKDKAEEHKEVEHIV